VRLLVTAAHDPHEPGTLDYHRKLLRLARELDVERNVLFLGEYQFQNGDRISADRLTTRDFYLISDVLFLPSQTEGFGLPLLEAALTRLPIVCSKIAPFTELAREDVCYFDLQDNPSQIATKMLNFAAGKHRRFFRRTKSCHLWDSIYRTRLVPLFQEVLEAQEAEVAVPA
jgi:glycosyltransferase involved in cell wall biosynthesis